MTEESPPDYLSKINWKTFVEYLTAEAVFNRPADPVTFCRDILNQKLEERGENGYIPQKASDWLKNCYAQASSNVDSNGILRDKSGTLGASKSSSNLSSKVLELGRKIDGLQKLLDASSTIATLDPLQATDNIVSETCRILSCDRATIFTTDFITQELVLHVAEGASNIRVQLGKGIAGTVGATGETINLTDAYADPRFNPIVDKATGYHTKTVLCMPITALDGRIIGVLQAINKDNDEVFSSSDEEVMHLLAIQAGIALRNANLYRTSESAREKFRSLLDIIRAMQGDMGINSLIFTITQRTIKVVDAVRCTLYVCDNVSKGLFAMQGEVNIKISMAQGIAGHVATTGQVLNIPDAYENPKFNQAFDKKSGFRTKAILCMPLKADDGTVVGVLQLINKSSGSGIFTTEDEDVMNIFLSIAGPIFASSHLYEQMQGKGNSKKGGEEKISTGSSSVKHDAGHVPRLTGFAEGEEADEDEEEEIH